MTTPVPIPPRMPDSRRSGGNAAERFAMQQPVNFLELLDNICRRLDAVENRLSRIHVPGG
jgi:hypothetical protein